MRLYCINLKRATDRRLLMEKNWAGFPIEYFDAVDRRDFKDAFPTDIPIHPDCPLNDGEIACCLSHIKLMQHALPLCDETGVIIMEDDIDRYVPSWEACQEAILFARKVFPDMLALGCHKPQSNYRAIERRSGILRIKKPPYGACFTWYSAEGLQKAINALTPINIPADYAYRHFGGKYCLLENSMAIDRYDSSYIGPGRTPPRRFIP